LPQRNLVLVVDDDPGMLKGIQRLLRQHAYETILFSSAEALKKHVNIEEAVCVILDINLKDRSGIELRHCCCPTRTTTAGRVRSDVIS